MALGLQILLFCLYLILFSGGLALLFGDFKVKYKSVIAIAAMFLGVAVLITLSAAPSEDEDEDTEQAVNALTHVEQAQQISWDENGHYADEIVELRLLDPSLNEFEQIEQIELQTDDQEQGYYAQIDDGQRFSVTVEQGLVIDRFCDDGPLCQNNSWSADEQR